MKKTAILLAALTLVGCATPMPGFTVIDLYKYLDSNKDWQFSENQVGQRYCIPSSGSTDADKNSATRLAKDSLLLNLKDKLNQADQIYTLKSQDAGISVTGVPFTQNARGALNDAKNSVITSHAQVETLGQEAFYCVRLLLNEKKSRAFFDQAIDASNAELSNRDKDYLYKHFLRH